MLLKLSKVFLVVIICLFVLTYCKNEPTEPINNSPVIQNVTASPNSIKIRETTTLSCVAIDENGDKLSYSWTAIDGSFPDGASESSANWKAPDTEGKYTIDITVSDGKATDKKNIEIDVINKTGSLEGFIYQLNTNFSINGVLIGVAGKSTISDENGKYQFDEITAGEVTIKASKSDYENYEKTVTIVENQVNKHDIFLTGSVLSTNISGNIWDIETNEPISGVKVTIANQVDYTDASGHYQLPNVPQGTHLIVAEKENFTIFQGEVFLSSSDKIFNIEMEYILSNLSGVISDGSTGEALKNVKVKINGAISYTNQSGYYEFNQLNKDSYIITATKDSYIRHQKQIVLDNNVEIYNITLSLEACPGIPTVEYAGQIYNTVLIGEQCWLKQNLNVGTLTYETNQIDNNIIEKHCYENDENYCNAYGGLYQWNEAMQYVTNEGAQGICPENWHIPTYEEILTLINFVDGDGNALKDVGVAEGTNTSGFTGLLAGFRRPDTGFFSIGQLGGFLSSTEINSSKSRRMTLSSENTISYSSSTKSFSFSVRCLKDSP